MSTLQTNRISSKILKTKLILHKEIAVRVEKLDLYQRRINDKDEHTNEA